MWGHRALIVFAVVAGCVIGAPASASETVTVVLNQARILRLPENTKTIVIGNPMIADIAMQKHGNLVLTGKSYGATNLIALDDKGDIIAESRIRVEAPQDAIVVVQRGMDRESYSCAPLCQPTISMGDGGPFFDRSGSQAEKHIGLAAPK